MPLDGINSVDDVEGVGAVGAFATPGTSGTLLAHDPAGAFGDNPFSLLSILGSPNLAATTFSIVPFLPPGTGRGTFYWTVQPVIVAADGTESHGPVSGPQGFYLDAPSSVLDGVGQATYDALRQFEDPLESLTFECTSIEPLAGQHFQQFMNQPAPPIPLTCAAFSVSLRAGQETLFRVWRTSLTDFHGETPVLGSWSLSPTLVLPSRWQPIAANGCMVFTPGESLVSNNRYTVEIPAGLLATDGQALERAVRYTFTSWYRPFHIDPYRVRQRLSQYGDVITDEQLYYAVWRASMRANRELMWYLPVTVYRGGPREEEVAAYTSQHSMSLMGFVELEATIRLLELLIGRAAEEAGVTSTFKDTSIKVDVSRIASIEAAIKAYRPEWESYYAEISSKRAKPVHVVKSSRWYGGYDSSYQPRGRF